MGRKVSRGIFRAWQIVENACCGLRGERTRKSCPLILRSCQSRYLRLVRRKAGALQYLDKGRERIGGSQFTEDGVGSEGNRRFKSPMFKCAGQEGDDDLATGCGLLQPRQRFRIVQQREGHVLQDDARQRKFFTIGVGAGAVEIRFDAGRISQVNQRVIDAGLVKCGADEMVTVQRDDENGEVGGEFCHLKFMGGLEGVGGFSKGGGS
jgi:hypothetical protein